ncbi:FCD domain-containing protein [Streptomyces sp. NPDC057717]|uniref:FCD domain-containing protein n=1 Tax=Streptomyces sp. NPDC057717 TaxID=3346224 RepID=UPI00367BB82A
MASRVPGLAGLVGGSLQVASRQHEAVTEAITAGEPTDAQTLMAEHIDMTAQQFQREK